MGVILLLLGERQTTFFSIGNGMLLTKKTLFWEKRNTYSLVRKKWTKQNLQFCSDEGEEDSGKRQKTTGLQFSIRKERHNRLANAWER